MSFDTLCPPAGGGGGARTRASCEARRGVSGAVVFYQHDSRPKLVIGISSPLISFVFLSFLSDPRVSRSNDQAIAWEPELNEARNSPNQATV
jgi:hypothetical protein